MIIRGSFKTSVEVLAGQGPMQETFSVHKRILTASSAFFKAALESSFEEGLQQKIELPENEPKTLNHFLIWLYTGQLMESMGTKSLRTDVDWDLLTSLYLFGDQYQIPKLQNDVMDALIHLHTHFKWVSLKQIPRVVDNLPETSPLPRYYVDKSVANAQVDPTSGWFLDSCREWYSNDFLFMVAKALVAHKTGKRPAVGDFWASRESYHVME